MKKNKIILIFFIIITLVIIVVAFYKFFISKNYYSSMKVNCDPEVENCFVYVCNPEEGDSCTGNLDEDTWYYKIIRKKTKNISNCNSSDENCIFECQEGERNCEEILCQPGGEDECYGPQDIQEEGLESEASDDKEESLMLEESENSEGGENQ